jgi:hypothetical protein
LCGGHEAKTTICGRQWFRGLAKRSVLIRVHFVLCDAFN